MRTTLSPKTIKYLKDDIWSPDMSFEQFAKAVPDLENVSQVVISQQMTRDEAKKIKEYYQLTKHNSEV